MRFFEYLFFKYYNWAIKVGDGDMPAITSVICISFGILIYFMDVIMAYYYFIMPTSDFSHFYFYIFPVVFLCSIVVLYIRLVTKDKDKQIMEKHKDEWTGKKHIGAILYPLIAIVLFGVELHLKMLMNQGET